MRAWLLASVIMCGCSGAVTDGFVPTPTDAGPTGPTNICPSNNVWQHTPGSLVLTAPQIHIVFWGNYWSTSANGAYQFAVTNNEWFVLGNDPAFYSPVSQYGVGMGNLSGTYLDNWEVPQGQMTEAAIQTELDAEMQNNVLPAANSQSFYLVLLPPNTQSQYNIQSSFSGHHGYHNGYAYGVCEFASDFTGVIAHEAWEAFTNPDTSNGWWGNGGETEVADQCQGNNTTWTLDGYNLPQVWNQKDCKCEP